MTIFDGNPFDPYSGGILGLLARNTPSLPAPGQPPSGFPSQAPSNVSAGNRTGVRGVTLPETSASGFGRGGDDQNPLQSLLGGIGNGISNLFSGGLASAANAAAPTPGAGQPQATPPGPAAAGPGVFDRLAAGATNLTTGGNPIAGLLNAANGLATGQRFDAQGIKLQQMAATRDALIRAGVPPVVAQVASMNPEVLKAIASQLYNKHGQPPGGDTPAPAGRAAPQSIWSMFGLPSGQAPDVRLYDRQKSYGG